MNQMLIEEGLWMIVDKIWKLTNTVRVGLDPRSSHSQRQTTFLDNLCSYLFVFLECFLIPRNCSPTQYQTHCNNEYVGLRFFSRWDLYQTCTD